MRSYDANEKELNNMLRDCVKRQRISDEKKKQRIKSTVVTTLYLIGIVILGSIASAIIVVGALLAYCRMAGPLLP